MGVDTSPEAIAALLDGVTPGPWHVAPDGYRVTDKLVTFDDQGARRGETPNIVIFAETKLNARFIAAARELVPAMAAEITRLTAERDRLVMALAETEALEMQHGEVIRRVMAERDALNEELREARMQAIADSAQFQMDVEDLTAERDAVWNAAIRAAAEACDWGDIYGDNAVRAILALLKPEESK